MIKNLSGRSILLKKYFGKLLLSFMLTAVLMLVQSGLTFASESVTDGLNMVQPTVFYLTSQVRIGLQ